MIPEYRLVWQHPLVRAEELLTAEGEFRLVLRRGTFAAVCLLLSAEDGTEAFLVVQQRRPTAETPFYEHPAGMLDGQESPLEAALREVAEETGWLLCPNDLSQLTSHPLYPSPAMWGEIGYFFAATLPIPGAVLQAYAQGTSRPTPEGEKLTLYTLPATELLARTQNLQTVAHTLLYYAAHGAAHRNLSPNPLTGSSKPS